MGRAKVPPHGWLPRFYGPVSRGRSARQAGTADRAVQWRPGARASPMVRRACPHIPAGPTIRPYALRPDGTRSRSQPRAHRRPGRDRSPSDAAALRAPPTSPVRGPRIWGTVPHAESRHIRDLGLVAESAAHVTPPTVPPGPPHSAARRVGASSRSSWNGIGRSEGRIAERVPRLPSPLKCPGHVQYDGPCQLIDGVTGEKGFRARSKTGR